MRPSPLGQCNQAFPRLSTPGYGRGVPGLTATVAGVARRGRACLPHLARLGVRLVCDRPPFPPYLETPPRERSAIGSAEE